MKKIGRLALLAAGVLFVAFFSNVAVGATGQKPLLGDIQEMATLFASAVLFAVAVLLIEANDGRTADQAPNES